MATIVRRLGSGLMAAFVLIALGTSTSEASGSLCADVPGFGADVCPGLANDPAGVLNNTHYSQIVGTTVDYQIRWAASETPDYVVETGPANGCAVGQVLVQIKSSALGNTTVCGTVDPTNSRIINFSWTSPANSCETGVVAYRNGTTGGGPKFDNTNNDILEDGVDNDDPNSSGGIGNVAAAGGPAVSCRSVTVTTDIHKGDDHTTPVISVSQGDTVHDKATVTGAGATPPTGTVTFTFFENGECTGPGVDAGTVTIVAGVADPSNSYGPLLAGFYSFRAHYNGDANHDEADGPCEPLEVTIANEPVGSLRACKYQDSNANGVKDGSEGPLSGWSMTINPVSGAPEGETQVTDDTGCVLWTNLTPGDYTVTEAAPAGGLPWFNTDPGDSGPCLMSGSSDAGFALCSAAPQKTATVTTGTTSQVNFGNLQSAEKHGQKFYDANVDSTNNDGEIVAGVKITLTGTDITGAAVGPVDKFTDASGNYSFTGLLPGDYVVTETLPLGAWLPTTATTIVFALTSGEKEEHNDFGNICLGAGGGRTLGFWSNRNGEARMNDGGGAASELALLSGLNLRNANGAHFDPANYTAFRTWILGATATNMAYMLSAQLAAMTLNVEAGFVSSASLVYAPGCGTTGPGDNFITIGELTTAANTTLGSDGLTLAGHPARANQECLKNGLDKANNNLNFVQPTACQVSYPAP